MRNLSFTKMQALGNDFVVVDGPDHFSTEEIVEICDRRFGVGADGVLLVTQLDPVRMEYWNADGSPSEMCGNGLRCVARYAYDKGWTMDRNFGVATPSGVMGVRVLDQDVEVQVGRPSVTGHTSIGDERYHLIDVGNPHAVAIVDNPEASDVSGVGSSLQTENVFENGTNVEFVSIVDGGIRMRVWERGVGETLSCGSGMVAAAFVATKTDNLKGSISVTMPGGTGHVEFREGMAWLRGPADYSFRGNAGGR